MAWAQQGEKKKLVLEMASGEMTENDKIRNLKQEKAQLLAGDVIIFNKTQVDRVEPEFETIEERVMFWRGEIVTRAEARLARTNLLRRKAIREAKFIILRTEDITMTEINQTENEEMKIKLVNAYIAGLQFVRQAVPLTTTNN